MEKKEMYVAPEAEVEILEVQVEKGFAGSQLVDPGIDKPDI